MRPLLLNPALYAVILLAACTTKRELLDYYEDLDGDGDGVIAVVDCEPQSAAAAFHLWYVDADGDGHGDPATQVDQCEAPVDGQTWVDVGDDCNDADAAAATPRTGYHDLDADGFGVGRWPVTLCDEGAALADQAGDCADDDAAVYPGAPAVCGNAKDDDCDALPDCDPLEGQRSAADADARWSGEGEEALGASVAVPGDIDGDGLDDLVVGAPDDRGAAYVLSGPFDGAADIDATATAGLIGTEGSAAGSALVGAGDVDGDGYDDFLVGAPGGEGGRAVLVYGPMRAVADLGDEAELSTGSLDMVELRLELSGSFQAGAAVAAPGDVRGNDGIADLVVGAPGTNAVYVVRGPLDHDVSLGEDADVQRISGSADQELGAALATVGDLDGDGRAELAVGAPGYAEGHMRPAFGDSGTGAVAVFFEAGNRDLDDADGLLFGGEEGAGFGSVLADAGDLDGDGLGDLAVGAPAADAGAGTVWVVTGAVLRETSAPDLGDALATLAGSADDEWAGTAMLGGVDLNVDGAQDLLVGSPGGRAGESQVLGGVGVWFGPLSGRYSTENADALVYGDGDDPQDLFGWSIAVSRTGDLFVGAPGVGAEESGGEDGEEAFGDGALYTFHLGW